MPISRVSALLVVMSTRVGAPAAAVPGLFWGAVLVRTLRPGT